MKLNDINLNDINQAWLERAASELGKDLEVTLNLILKTVRERIAGDSLEHWMEEGQNLRAEWEEQKLELTRTRESLERAARTAQIYLEQVNRREKP